MAKTDGPMVNKTMALDEHPKTGWFRFRPWRFLTPVGVLFCTATLLGFPGAWAWYLDLFAHFRVQYFVGLSLLAIPFYLTRRFRTALVFTAFALANLAVIIPLYVGPETAPPGRGRALRVMLVNVNTRAGDPARVATVIRRYSPDVLVLEEIDAAWLERLRPVLAGFRASLAEPRDDNFGIGVFSRLPFRRAEVVGIGVAGVPSIVAELDIAPARLAVIATHPLPPAGRLYARWRDEHLERLAERARRTPGPLVVLGDLNATPWSHAFRSLLARSGLKDSSRGFGVQPTWPSGNLFLRIPLDHCLHSPDVRVRDRVVGPYTGSDHYPLVVDLELPSD
ncbi:MAG: endonuclease/exonuclease/phosphatase family protein [Acidobacteria bacterium]|nr:endonuclease/exonuclease/phosphatase family protein [Acidobacteriota bacterium]